ncbi:MAG: glycosyltransferase [Alphaproteobacteria bacterium]|nr:glycosyltransferase [Alphaproteobacteria bacterium]
MIQQPLVSILMTCYNHEGFVIEAVMSCLNQTYPNIEIVIADDFSTDSSAEIIQGLASQYPQKIKFLRNTENIGLTKNLNQALRHCRGQYIAFISADDIFLPEKIDRQMRVMEKNDNAAISYHDVQVFRESDNSVLYNISDRYKPLSGNFEIMLNGGMFFSCLGCMVRRSDVPTTGYDEQIKLCSDWFFMAETLILSEKNIIHMSGLYALHRRHDNNITSKYQDRLIDEEQEAIARLFIKYPHLENYIHIKEGHLLAMKILKLLSALKFKKGVVLLSRSKSPFKIFLNTILIARKELFWRIFSLKYSIQKIRRL